MKIVEAIRTFIATCPNLKDLSSTPTLNIDKVDQEAVSYSISPIPVTKTLKEYISGDKLEGYQFLFLLRAETTVLSQYIDNHNFYENFSDWLDTQTEAENFPTLESDKTVEKIEAINVAYLSSQEESGATAVYQIICQLTYRQKGA